mgnify:FL=1
MIIEEWEYEKSIRDQQYAYALMHRVSYSPGGEFMLGTCTNTRIHPTLNDTVIFVEFDCGYSEWLIPNDRRVVVHFE